MLTLAPKRRVLVFKHPTRRTPISDNSTVLIIVSVLVTLGLVGMVAGVRYTCRGDRRSLGGLLDEPEDDALLIEQHDRLADETAAKDQAAQVDSDIEAFRERGRLKNSVARASETAHLREQLSDRDDRTA